MPRAAAAAAATSAVLDNDDLLGEILLRLAFPTSLVRAALVCKRWLRLASAPAFLRHFRHLHPPHLLGFYVTTRTNPPRFVPMPQPPELASVVRRASFDLDTTTGRGTLGVCYCWNGLFLVTSEWRAIYTRRVLCPLYSARYLATLPSLPETDIHDGFTYRRCEILPNGRGGDGMPYFYFAIGWCNKEEQSVLDVYVLQDDIWAIYASVITEIPRIDLLLPNSLIVGDRIYNMACVGGSNRLVSLDLSSSCLSLVNLPEEVEFKRTELSLENDYSEVHLNHVKGSQLRIWLHMVNNDDGLANWLLVNTICLHEICADYMIPTSVLEDVGDSKLLVYAAGVDSGLFFMEKDEVLYLFDIKHKTVKKVFEATREDKRLDEVTPFMMVWPPKFPGMTDEGCDPI